MSSTLQEVLASGTRSFSFEFFPPKTDAGEQHLWDALDELEGLNPTFVSVTYGSGGSTRDRTIGVIKRISQETLIMPVGHLTCVGASEAELLSVVDQYAQAGVVNILALRGDPPGGPAAEWTAVPGGLTHAVELVSLVRQAGDFCVGVAAFPDPHPASGSADVDASVLLAKQQAGASFAITQFFFTASRYHELVERSAAIGVTIPIIPGIMPVTNLDQIRRFAALSGTQIPPQIVQQFDGVDKESVPKIGIELASELSAQLLAEGAPGLHFYTLNRSTATRQIYANLGLPR
ncbi:MAG: methylenetetrahydrofolate reductase [NAD(P)H] [Actinomycetes bacterium]